MTRSCGRKEGFFCLLLEYGAAKGGARVERARKQRLVYGLWALLCGLVLLGALPTFWTDRWPPALAHDQIFILTRQSELLQFSIHQEGVVSRHPWTGGLIGVPRGSKAAGVWAYSGWERTELTQFRPADWRLERSIELGAPYGAPLFTPDGSQIQAPSLPDTDHERIGWIDLKTGSRIEAEQPCLNYLARLLPPLRRDEAFLFCLWELWAITPSSERPLLTTSMGGRPGSCLGFAGRPFGVAVDQRRKRLWVTGEGGLLCQIDPATSAMHQVATLPIKESERVELTDLQHAPATDLLYVGVHQWDTDQVRRLLVWDLKQNRLRSEIQLAEPLRKFHPTSDGGHLIGLTSGWPGEPVYRLVLIDVATGKVDRELGRIESIVLDWTLLPE